MTDVQQDTIGARTKVRHRPAVVVTCGNQKGGVGKTATCASLATALARDYAVLAIDLDHQNQLSDDLSIIVTETTPTAGEWIQSEREDGAEHFIVPSDLGLDVVPARAKALSDAAGKVRGDELRGHRFLAKRIATIRDRYDFIIIDLPAGLETLTNVGLGAVDVVLPVVTPDVAAWLSCIRFLERVKDVSEYLNPGIKVGPIIRNAYNTTKAPSEQQRDIDAVIVGSEYEVSPVIIPRSEYISKARLTQTPAERLYERHSSVHGYRTLANELVAWCEERGL